MFKFTYKQYLLFDVIINVEKKLELIESYKNNNLTIMGTVP